MNPQRQIFGMDDRDHDHLSQGYDAIETKRFYAYMDGLNRDYLDSLAYEIRKQNPDIKDNELAIKMMDKLHPEFRRNKLLMAILPIDGFGRRLIFALDILRKEGDKRPDEVIVEEVTSWLNDLGNQMVGLKSPNEG